MQDGGIIMRETIIFYTPFSLAPSFPNWGHRSAVSSPAGGVWGGGPAEIEFGAF